MTTTPSELFTHAELMQLEAEANCHTRALSSMTTKAIITFGLALLLALTLACEYQFLLEIFSYLKGGSSGGDTQWSVGLLSAMGVLAVIAFHLRVHGTTGQLAILIGRFVDVTIPVYALGVGLVFAAILWNDGADSLAGSSGELFSDPATQTTRLLDYFSRGTEYFGVVFVIGCGGIAIINLFIAHGLLERIRSNIDDVTAKRDAAKLAEASITTIRACQRDYAALHKEREQLISADEGEAENALAHHIMTVIGSELLAYERYVNEQKFRAPASDARLRLPEDPPFDLDEMQKRIAVLKSINTKSILAAMRS